MGLINTALGTFGAYQEGHAKAQAAKYNSAVARRNAEISRQNAVLAGQAGAQQATVSSLKTRAAAGEQLANTAASGLDVNKGSPVDLQASTRELGEMDALTIRSNAVKEAYGYNVKAVNEEAQSTLDKFEGKNAELSGEINAGSTFLGSVSDSTSNFMKFQLAGGFGG